MRRANRRREGYELTRQRDMLPVALGAACAAIVLHIMAYVFAPSLLRFEFARPWGMPDRVQDELVRVVVKDRPEEEFSEAETPEVPDDAPAEPEQLVQEPVEIDVLDVEVEELVMAPGETSLAVPEPVSTAEESTPVSEMKPTEIDLAAMGLDALPSEAVAMPEPAPVNSNLVVAQVTAQPEDVEDASRLMEEEMRRQAKEGKGQLPGDTRSLSELMGEQHLGASSGVARLGTDLLFAFNQCQLKNSARISMLQLAALIQKNPETQFVIEGHTDSIGRAEYNALLSLQRAAAVRAWLVKNGVPVKHVYIRARGNQDPLVDTAGSREQQALNRRVEIHMRKKGEVLPSGCIPSTQEVDLETPVSAQLAAGVRVPSPEGAASASATTASGTSAVPRSGASTVQRSGGRRAGAQGRGRASDVGRRLRDNVRKGIRGKNERKR